MLFFLTGEIQTGKTRWLQSVIEHLEQRHVEVCGVVAPGVWEKHAAEGFAGETFVKLGIDNVLLPEHASIPFARRSDLARATGTLDGGSQSARAGLQWAIDDRAIDLVNAHFDKLSALQPRKKRLLVVDELGRLELLRCEGLTSAVALLDRGATPLFPHALAIVRADLLATAQTRFANAPWNGMCAIGADDASADMLLRSYMQ